MFLYDSIIKSMRFRFLSFFSSMMIILLISPSSFFSRNYKSQEQGSPKSFQPESHPSIPLSFIPITSQANLGDHFMLMMGHQELLFSQSKISILSINPASPLSNPNRQITSEVGASEANDTVSSLNLIFDGDHSATKLARAQRLPGIANFYLGNDPSQWKQGLPTFAVIDYQNLYPGIDLDYQGSGGQLEGTYTLSPGANPDLIRWHYQDAQSVRVDPMTGKLKIDLVPGSRALPQEMIEQPPLAWQTVQGQRRYIRIRYALGDHQNVHFVMGSYDRTLPLTIDPILSFSTYLGGSKEDTGSGIALDRSGNIFVVGTTYSSDFPTLSPYQNTLNGDRDVFVTKMDASGSSLIYSTFIGGSGTDEGYAIASDSNGNGKDELPDGDVWVTGKSLSQDFPTTAGAYAQTSRK